MSFFGLGLTLFWLLNFICNSFDRAFLNQVIITTFVWVYVGVGSYIDSSLIRVDYWQISSIITAVFCFALLVRNNIVSIRLLFLWSLIALNIVFLIINPVADAVVVGYGGNYEAVLGGMAQYQSPAFSKFSFLARSL